MSLLDQARAFLEASNYSVETRDRDLLLGEQPGLGGRRERICVWVLTREDRENRQQLLIESDLEKRFEGAIRKYPGAKLYLLAESVDGFSSDFRNQILKQFGASIRVPVQFFDVPFKSDFARAGASAVGDLLREAQEVEKRRVPQHYERLNEGTLGEDLVLDIEKDIQRAALGKEPKVWFITAPAGYGKSIFFKALFARIYNDFQEQKQKQQLFPRPFPMFQDHQRASIGDNFRAVIDAFLRSDLAILSSPALFDYIIDNRFGLLMLDGLDELILRDDNFLSYMEERITRPGTKPAILVCVRDSLLQSSSDLRAFVDYYRHEVDVYALAPWDEQSLRRFAWRGLEARMPRSSESDSTAVVGFLKAIRDNTVCAKLATQPYYANMLLESYRSNGTLGTVTGELDVLEVAVQQMCEREYGKGGAISKENLPSDSFIEWLENLALDNYQYGGVPIEKLQDWAELLPALVTKELDEEEEKGMVRQITMAPFLRNSATDGRVEFSHEILADYLVGRALAKELKPNKAKFASHLSQKVWEPGAVLVRSLAANLVGDADRLADLAATEYYEPTGFHNLVQLMALIPGGDELFRTGRLQLEGANLSDILLTNLDLSGVSFRGSDLSGTDFSGSTLRGTGFEGALLNNTRFVGLAADALGGARFGDAEHFESVLVGDRSSKPRRLETYRTFTEWQSDRTGEQQVAASAVPCPTARQVLHLFRKFVHVNGESRRNALDERALVRGARYQGAPDPEDCLKAAVDFGYLKTKADPRERIGRADGLRYGEIVTFVKGTQLSEGLRALLDSLCRGAGCQHWKPAALASI